MTRNRPRRPAALTAVLLAVIIGLGALVMSGAAAAVLTAIGVTDPSPPGDDFADAIPVAGSRLQGTTAGARADGGEVAAGAGAAGQRVIWFAWTAPRSGWAYVTAASGPGAALPAVRAFSGPSVDSLVRRDEAVAGGGIGIPAIAGEPLALAVVDDGDGRTVDFVITQPGGRPPGDDTPRAIDIGAAITDAATDGIPRIASTATTHGASAAAGEVRPGGAPAERSVWFAWSPGPSGGSVNLTATPVFGGAGPLVVGLWRAGPSGPEPLAGGTAPSVAMNAADAAPTGRLLVSVDGPATWFRLDVESVGVAARDTSAPVISCTPPGGWSNGATISVPCTAVDTGVGLADPADATFSLTADVPADVESDQMTTNSRLVCDRGGLCATAGPVGPLKVDRLAPVTSCGAAPTGWSGAPVPVRCEAADSGSGLADLTQGAVTVELTVGPGEERMVSGGGARVCDVAGNCSDLAKLGPVGIDRRPPTISCPPSPSGWQRAQVSIVCTAGDGGSGLGRPAEVTLTTSVAANRADAGAMTGFVDVCDVAGNCTNAGPLGPFQVDLAPPTAVCPAPGSWSAGPTVTVPCTLTDEGSGLDPSSPAKVDLTASVADGIETDDATTGVARACDRAGSCVDVGPVTGLRIDRKAPAVTCADPGQRWHRSTVTVSCGVLDGGAGLADPSQSSVALTAAAPPDHEGVVATSSTRVCDAVGHCASAGPVGGLHVDTRAPTVTCDPVPTATQPTNVRIGCRASDAGSGLGAGSQAVTVLRTSVPGGKKDASAETDAVEVCDAAGGCVDVGPFTVPVDRTAAAPGAGPVIPVPGRVTVVAAIDPVRPVSGPYPMPLVTSAVGPAAGTIAATAEGRTAVRCDPGRGGAFPEGWTIVTCTATDDADRTSVAGFPLVVKALPALAPTRPATNGGAWRVVGVGYRPGSDVELIEGDVVLGRGVAAGDGRVSITITFPAAPGTHQLALRGTDRNGDPLITVSEVASGAAAAGAPAPSQPPAGAPTLPASGPALPADPGPPPAAALPQARASDVGPVLADPGPQNAVVTEGSTPTSGGPGAPGGGPSGSAAPASAGAGAKAPQDERPLVVRATGGLLPSTGAAVGTLLLIGIASVGIGLALRIAARRRRDPQAETPRQAQR